jgi:hypothetical protein
VLTLDLPSGTRRFKRIAEFPDDAANGTLAPGFLDRPN